MIYDIMYRDGGNYKKHFRGEIPEKKEEDEYIEMERSGMKMRDFFRKMGWTYDDDYDHNQLEITGKSEDQDSEPDVVFLPEQPVEEHHAAVDVPPHHPNQGGLWEDWTNLESFETKEQAIEWAQKHLGADENGMICVISTF